MPDPIDFSNPVALDPIEDNVFFVPELADDSSPPAEFSKLCAVFPTAETVPPTVFPTVLTPEDRTFPAVPTPDPITFPVVLIALDAAGLRAFKVALYVLPAALNKFCPNWLPGEAATTDDGELFEDGEFPGDKHCDPLHVLHGPVEEQHDVHFGKTGGTICDLRI
jgi:hypothetical protein